MGTCETPYAGSAGIIWGLLTGPDPLDTVDPVAASDCLKHSMAADFNLVGFEEIQALVGGDGSGRIRRWAS
jgi:2-dehydro-3-deoxygluconokinase